MKIKDLIIDNSAIILKSVAIGLMSGVAMKFGLPVGFTYNTDKNDGVRPKFKEWHTSAEDAIRKLYDMSRNTVSWSRQINIIKDIQEIAERNNDDKINKIALDAINTIYSDTISSSVRDQCMKSIHEIAMR